MTNRPGQVESGGTPFLRQCPECGVTLPDDRLRPDGKYDCGGCGRQVEATFKRMFRDVGGEMAQDAPPPEPQRRSLLGRLLRR